MNMAALEVHIKDWPRWMSVDVAAAYMCRSKKYVEMLVRTGTLPAIRSKVKNPDGSVSIADTRIDRNKIDKYMESGEINTAQIKKDIIGSLK